MSVADFYNVVDQCKSHLMYLMLYFQGEPLLNADLFRMISYAKKRRIYTATSTNGHFLNDENAQNIVESGLDRLIISMDGTDQETYEKYRREGDWETVRKGVKEVVKWKTKLKSSGPFLILQFIVFKHNEHQLQEIKRLGRELEVNKVEIKSAQVYNFKNDTEFIPQNLKYSRYVRGADGQWELKKPVRNHCFRMWGGAVITWDGRLVPCCFDKDARHQMGRLDNHSLREIWNMNEYRKFRNQIIEDRTKIDICQNCTE